MPKCIVRRANTTKKTTQLSSLPPLLQKIYLARKIESMNDIDRSLSALLPYQNLSNIEKAAARLADAIEKNQFILIIGDFDADGATSTAVAVAALKLFGATKVDFLVPNRFTFGYGLTPEIVDVAATKSPDLIITVDNGISSIDGVARANHFNIDVIVTDHHLQGDQLPDAFAIVNPNQKNDLFESKNLAGVGVIFYVMLAVRAELILRNYFTKNNINKPNLANLLDLVALGTIADVVPLDKNNRVLVHQGLQRIRANKACPGIQALLKITNKDYINLIASDLGFSIGPRLNAAGRLDDMSLGIHCLLESNVEKALEKAEQLDQLNHERRAIENDMKNQAFQIVDQLDFNKALPIGICLYDANWHQGVIGLVASRVKEKLNRPVIAFANAGHHIIKGSARSVYGVHIRDILDCIAKKYPDLLSKFGGHAMAAGLSIHQKDFQQFSIIFSDIISQHLTEDQLKQHIESDGVLNHADLTLENAHLLREAGPWGQHFPEPIFDGEFDIVNQRLVGGAHLKLVLKPIDGNYCVEAIAFQVDRSEE